MKNKEKETLKERERERERETNSWSTVKSKKTETKNRKKLGNFFKMNNELIIISEKFSPTTYMNEHERVKYMWIFFIFL